jgi:hypothetical protein
MQPADQHQGTSVPLLAQALAHLEATKKRWPDVSRESGVPYSTITKIYQRVIRDPRVSTVQRLLDHRDGAALNQPGSCPDKGSAGETITEFGQTQSTPFWGDDSSERSCQGVA